VNPLLPILALVGGIFLGGFAIWLVLRARMGGTAAELKAQLGGQIATLTERVTAKEGQINQLQSALAAEEDQKTQLAMQLQEESKGKAVAEERSSQLDEQLKERIERIQQVQGDLSAGQEKLTATANELASARAGLEAERQARLELSQAHQQARAGLESFQAELMTQKGLNSELTQKLLFLEERLATQRQEIEVIQQKFQKEFEAVANRLLVENSSRFGQQSAESLSQLLTPFRENLNDFKARLEKGQKEAAEDSGRLKEQIAHIGTEAANLSKALKGDVKVLGNWGENMLDQILERSGLQLGVHYRRQGAAKDDQGDQRFLDVIVDLPEDKHLVIDSKVSLKAYEEYVNSAEEAARNRHLQAHVDSLRTHFRGLGAKRYHELHGITSPDFVLMYVPIEAAFFVAVGEDPRLFSEALDKNVILTTNSTLLATLRTVAHVWRLADQQKHALEIADRGGKLYDKFVGFVDDLQGIGAALTAAQGAWSEANKKLHQGPGNLVGQVEKLRALGVKASKRLPDPLVAAAEATPPPLVADANGSVDPGSPINSASDLRSEG